MRTILIDDDHPLFREALRGTRIANMQRLSSPFEEGGPRGICFGACAERRFAGAVSRRAISMTDPFVRHPAAGAHFDFDCSRHDWVWVGA